MKISLTTYKINDLIVIIFVLKIRKSSFSYKKSLIFIISKHVYNERGKEK